MKLTGKEERLVRRTIHEFERKLRKDYPPGKMLRPVHPKVHGCVEAFFSVDENIDPSFKIGIFKSACRFESVIRFSNSSGTISDDKHKDVRGMAIKLIDGNNLNFQDFVLISHNRFITADVHQYFNMVRAVTRGGIFFVLFALNPFNWKGLSRMAKSRSNCDNVLGIPYFGASPYMLGQELAVKYAIFPSTVTGTTNDQTKSRNFLRERLFRQLAQQEACFDFLIQTKPATEMGEKDSVEEWNLPYVKVGNIRIPIQELLAGECDNKLTFAPWHCQPEHQPLGKINLIRKAVYEALAKFRQSNIAE